MRRLLSDMQLCVCVCPWNRAGEILWVKRMIQAHHAAAAAKGVKVVHCCGYDSIPFDLGALVVVDHMRRALGK